MTEDIIYLDHAAATPVDKRVLAAMMPYFSESFFNPSSPYHQAITVRRAYEAAKQSIAVTLGARADELIVTAGATEANNLAMTAAADGHVVTASSEHDSVLAAARRYDHTIVNPDQKGAVSPAAVAGALTSATTLVSVSLANNELGTIQPLTEIVHSIEKERQHRAASANATPLYLHIDASQGVGQIDINVARLGVDLMTVNAGKIYGPKQVAILWSRPEVQLFAQIVGGGQERGRRSGTENVAGVIGMSKALELAEKSRKSEAQRLKGLRDSLQLRLMEAFPEAVVSGHLKRRLASHLHISFPGLDAERLLFMLESKGVLVATGSACAANKHTGSHVLAAIGLPPEIANGSLRLTFGHLSDEATTKRAGDIIIDVITQEKQRLVRKVS